MATKTSTFNISVFNSFVKGVGMMMLFLFGIHFQSIGLSGLQMGIVFAIFPITNILTILPSGLFTDRLNAKNLIIIALILGAIRYLGMAISDNFFIIAAMFFIAGIGQAIYKSASEGLFYKTTQNQEVEGKISQFQGFGYICIGIGMMVSGYLLSIDLSFHKIFLIVGILYLILALLSIFMLPKNKTAKFEIMHYKKELLQTKALFMLLVVFLFSFHMGAESTSYGLFLKNNLKLSPLYIGIYMGSAITVMALGVSIIAKYNKKIGIKNILFLGLFLSGGFLILMTVQNPWLSFTFRILHEIGDSAFFFFLFYGVLKLFHLDRVGGHAGVISFVTTISLTISSLIFASIGNTFGHQWPLIIGGATTLSSFVLALLYTRLIDHS